MWVGADSWFTINFFFVSVFFFPTFKQNRTEGGIKGVLVNNHQTHETILK
jgi:hypothetical protein